MTGLARLSSAQLDRAVGVLIGTAAGDALGAPYEFHPPLTPEQAVEMIGGGTFGWERGEWTDDTSMALVIAQTARWALSMGTDLSSAPAQDRIGVGWHAWAEKAPDVGAQTRGVLNSANHAARSEFSPMRAGHLRAAAAQLHERSGRSAGNGSLMRSAPVALAYLHDEDLMFAVARSLSRLTHFDEEAGEACALWCAAIRHAVLTGSLNVRRGLARLGSERRAVWTERIEAAEQRDPASFEDNGWVVEAFQAAWSAVVHSREALECEELQPSGPGGAGPEHRADRVARGIELAARSGNHTDTVAAITGALLAAAYGASAVPAQWRRVLHGWPGLRERDLVELAVVIARGDDDPACWPLAPRLDYPEAEADDSMWAHPYDDGVLIGGVRGLDELPVSVDAVVSLCRVGSAQVPSGMIPPADHVQMWVDDSDHRLDNPNLPFVLDDAARTILALRREQKTVYVHGVTAHGHAAAVAARYGSLVGAFQEFGGLLSTR